MVSTGYKVGITNFTRNIPALCLPLDHSFKCVSCLFFTQYESLCVVLAFPSACVTITQRNMLSNKLYFRLRQMDCIMSYKLCQLFYAYCYAIGAPSQTCVSYFSAVMRVMYIPYYEPEKDPTVAHGHDYIFVVMEMRASPQTSDS